VNEGKNVQGCAAKKKPPVTFPSKRRGGGERGGGDNKGKKRRRAHVGERASESRKKRTHPVQFRTMKGGGGWGGVSKENATMPRGGNRKLADGRKKGRKKPAKFFWPRRSSGTRGGEGGTKKERRRAETGISENRKIKNLGAKENAQGLVRKRKPLKGGKGRRGSPKGGKND